MTAASSAVSSDVSSDGPLRIFTAGATREGIGACIGPFTEETGIAVVCETTHGHLIRDIVIAGETDADIVALPAHMIEDLRQRGLVGSADCIDLGTIRIGAAIREGQPPPDVSTVAALRQTMIRAPSIVLTEAPSGVHLDALIDSWGLRRELEARITRYDTGTMVNEHLVQSTIDDEIAFGVATEIIFFRDRGVAYAGPLPDEVQMSHDYVAATLARTDRAEDARRLFDYLETDEARAAFARTGVDRE